MELIRTNGKRDSATKFASPEVCIPFAPNVNQGDDARYARQIYSLSYRSIVWSLLRYCVRARGHCCVLSDATRDLPFTWHICTSRSAVNRLVSFAAVSGGSVACRVTTLITAAKETVNRPVFPHKWWKTNEAHKGFFYESGTLGRTSVSRLPLGKIIRKIKRSELKSEFIFSLISYEYILWIHLIDYILISLI